MDIDSLISRKTQEADSIQASITSQQADLDDRLEVVAHLRDLKLQSAFSTEDVNYLFEQYHK